MQNFKRRDFLKAVGLAGTTAVLPWQVFGQEKEKFIYAETEGYHWSVPYVASGADTWGQAGLAPQTEVFTWGKMGMNAMLAGKVDVSIAVDAPFILPALRGLKPVLIAPFSRTETGARLTVRGDRIKSPEDLKGKTVTTLFGTGTHFFLRQFLVYHGIPESEVKIVHLSPPNMVTALARGDVDAMAWDMQTGIRAIERGNGKVEFLPTPDSAKYWRLHCVMMAHPDFVARRPQTCDKIALALKLAVDYIDDEPDKAAQIVADRTKTTLKETQAGMSDFDFRLRFDDQLLDDLVAQAEWLIEKKDATRPSNDLRQFFLDHFYLDGFRTHVPDGVTITGV